MRGLNWPKSARSLSLITLGLATLILALTGSKTIAQQDEMEVIERVADLMEQLNATQIPVRDKAQAELIKLGPMALDHLELPDDASSDLQNRLNTIRKTLEKQAVIAVSQSSMVSLTGEMTVDQALAQIGEQTGNQVQTDIQPFGDFRIKPDLQQVTFWEALEWIMTNSNLGVDPFGGEPGLLKLTPVGPGPQSKVNRPSIPMAMNKIFRVELPRVVSAVNIAQPELNHTTLTMVVSWEPRLRPISVDLPLAAVKILDEFDQPIQVTNVENVLYGMIQPELPQLEFSLPLKRVDRQVEQLKSVRARIEALLPGRIETFRFRNLQEQKVGRISQRAGATVTYGGIRKNEDIYMVTLSLSFDEQNNALESHQGWVFQNEVYLEDENQGREDAIGFETIQQDPSKITIRYLFIDDPGNRTLVYKTPAAIVKMPVDITIKKIPLP